MKDSAHTIIRSNVAYKIYSFAGYCKEETGKKKRGRRRTPGWRRVSHRVRKMIVAKYLMSLY